jgi:capsular polysaccharide export protein
MRVTNIPHQQRLFYYNGGFATQRRVRRILQLAGYSLHLGVPQPEDAVVIWGNAGTAHRGKRVAQARQVPLGRIEDAFLRSVHPGRSGSPPMGLLIDRQGLHFDPHGPSDLETLLGTHPLDDPALLARSEAGIARMAEAHLSKYTAFPTEMPPDLPDRFVLVIDQTFGDASVRASGAGRDHFQDMLAAARAAHPDVPIVVKTHPETQRGFRQGYFGPSDAVGNISPCTATASPWMLFDRATAVYTLSSQMGFEAILAGHKPHVFGHPFYAGWGLSHDITPLPRRNRHLTPAQLFAGAMILYPTWYDPHHDRLCSFEDAMEALAAQTRAWREDHQGWVASGMRLWKRQHIQAFFGSRKAVRFDATPQPPRRQMIWAGKDHIEGAVQVEDGFLRSKGLGAELTPPLSLVCDDIGIYYDPDRPSRIEAWIAKRAALRPDQEGRAQALMNTIRAGRISKYNLTGGQMQALPEGHRILVPGQVADDASIRLGTDRINSNQALLEKVRQENPDAIVLYKPHPDVEAALRPGAIDAEGIADLVLTDADPIEVLGQVDAVWTMTSLLGFEALVRGVPVVTLGAPFYAGWGLTTDVGRIPARRQARVTLPGLVHAALIDYPRYRDPVTGLPCPVEVIVDRLAKGNLPPPRTGNRVLSKLQGILASQAWLWRR